MNFKTTKFHFVGVGGIGMCGLAELLHNMGATVSGSDLQTNNNTDRLQNLGIKVFKGHQHENLGDVDVVVYSSAVQFSNVELMKAQQLKIPLIPRAEALSEIMRLKRGIAIAGTHGKTTTTSMVAAIFLHQELQPTIVVGGRMDLIKSTAILGKGEWFIAEADESDGSFQKLNPEYAIVTNIDNDHLDHYKTNEKLDEAFLEFGNRIPFYGNLIACGDDQRVRQVFTKYRKKILYYGFDSKNDFVLTKVQSGIYQLADRKKDLGTFQVNLPGKHNALNAAAAIALSLQVGISFADCAKGLLNFHGVDRRMEKKGTKNACLVYDDYGHHPTEVNATLSGFKEKFPDKNIVVLFQPHRYSRTKTCWNEFLTCFKDADQLLITDIYSAGETPIDGINSQKLVEAINHRNKNYIKKEEIESFLRKSNLKDGDLLLTLGAGDVWKFGAEFVKA